MKKIAYILDAKRTIVGRFGGSFIRISATELGSIVIKALLDKNPAVNKHIDEVIMGNVLSAGLGQNPARIAAWKAGIEEKVPSYTVNKVCGSGLKSIMLAAQSIQNGDSHVIIAGGMENMSLSPYLIDNHRFGIKLGNQTIKDSMIYDGLFCNLINETMGITAENIAKKYNVSRQDQDRYVLSSHRKTIAAIKNNKFKKEIVPIDEKDTDEQPRKNTSLEALRKLSPVFKKNGTVTAGNASSLNDAAAATIVVSEEFIKNNNLRPMAKIIGFSSVGLDPRFMGLGSYYAVQKCLSYTKLKFSDINLWEINEAFASQSIVTLRMLGIEGKKVNVNGGALALGHPIGASGARILTTLLHELKRRDEKYGIATLCIGGGQGVAMLDENL